MLFPIPLPFQGVNDPLFCLFSSGFLSFLCAMLLHRLTKITTK